MKRLFIIPLLLLGLATYAFAVNLCAITGTVQLPDGTACANCAITVNSLKAQTVSNQIINPVLISTTTDGTGTISSFNVAQGLAVQITITTSQGTTGAPFTAIIPFSASVAFSNLAVQSNVTGSFHLNDLLPPTGSVNFNSQRAINLATDIATGDALSRAQSKTTSLADWCPTTPTANQIPVFAGTQWCPNSTPEFNWANQIDLCASGFACDYQINNLATTVNNGNATLVITPVQTEAFKSTDCNVTHGGGCTGTKDKLIYVYHTVSGSGYAQETFAGTIIGFTNSTTVTLSGNYQDINATDATTVWGSDDYAATLALQATIGNPVMSQWRTAKVWCHAPVLLSQTWVLDRMSVDFGGPGAYPFLLDNTNNLSRCAVFGGQPGIAGKPVMDIQGNRLSYYHDFCVVGSTTLNEPLALIGTNNTDAGGTATSNLNTLERLGLGSCFAPSNLGTQIKNPGTPTNDAQVAHGSTSIQLTAAPTGLQANAPVLLVDNTGAAARWEIVYTSSSYTPGSNPIVLGAGTLVTGVQFTHLAVNTSVYWDSNGAQAVAGVYFPQASTQDDMWRLNSLNFIGVQTCIDMRTNQSVQDSITDMLCGFSTYGIAMPNGGSVLAQAIQNNGVSIDLSGNHARISVNSLADQPTLNVDVGTRKLYLEGAIGNFGVTLNHVEWAQNDYVAPDGDFAQIGPQPGFLDLQNFNFLQSSVAPPLTVAKAQPTILNVVGAAGLQGVSISYHNWDGAAYAQVNYTETGTPLTTSYRHIKLCDMGSFQTNHSGHCVDSTLRGADVWDPFTSITPGLSKLYGVSVPAMGTPPFPISLSVVGGTGTTYYYFDTLVVGSPCNVAATPTCMESLPSSPSAPVSAAATLDANNYVWGTVIPTLGASYVNIYRGTTNVASASKFQFSVPVNTSSVQNTHAPNQTGFFDNGQGTNSGAPPVSDLTGAMNASGPVIGSALGLEMYFSAAGTSIPTCNSGTARQFTCVSDSTACSTGTTYVSGGATKCLLECNTAGTAWIELGILCY